MKTLQKLGDIEVEANNLVDGRKFMLDALSLAQAKGIDNLVKRGLIDLGNTFLAETKYAQAEDYFQQSLKLSLQQKDARNSARARLSLASLAERQGNSDQVITYIEQALPFYQQGGYRKQMLQALALYGRAKVQKGEYDDAAKAFQQELEVAQQFDDQAQAGLAHEDLGLLLLKRSQYTQALPHFEETYKIAKSLGTIKNINLSLIDRANAFWRLGRYDDARAALAEAAPVATRDNAPELLSATYCMSLARLELTQRHFPEAVRNSQKAFTLAGTQLKRTAIMATFTGGLAQVLSGSASGGSPRASRS